jgi:hypothetical protein
MRSLRLLCLPLISCPHAIPENLREAVDFENHHARWKDIILDIHRLPQRIRLGHVLTEMMETYFDLPGLQCAMCGIIDGECSCHLIFFGEANT